MANEQDLTPLLETQQKLLGTLLSDGDSLDNKAMALAAINITLLIFAAQADLHIHGLLRFASLAGPFVGSVLFNIVTILPKPYAGHSVDLSKHPEYLELNKEDLTLQLLSDTQAAIIVDQEINRKYWRFWLISLGLTILGTVALLAILLV